ncbi:cell division protein [Erythrobacter sp. LQ02-29]|uniref:cell division protein FtsX n=1 Tax=Erythrobacter sp. LQ02-29 TaxID=2920384 RepID=UPI00211B67F6|nr:cell division protein [Erythrobacter sp. LQ02-29]
MAYPVREAPPAGDTRKVTGLARFRGARAAQLLPRTRLAGPVPWVIAIMVALTVVAAAAALALSHLAGRVGGDLAGGATVQIVQADRGQRERQAVAARDALTRSAEVATVHVVPAEEVERLLAPWLGEDGADSESVPIPALIDVTLRGAATPERLRRLRVELAAVAPDARIDAASRWLEPVVDTIASLRWLAIALIALLGATSAAAVFLAARSALGGNRSTIEVVHLLGGTDTQIARVFQRSVRIDAAVGGAIGFLVGLIIVLTLGSQFAGLGSGLVGGGVLRWFDWLLLALVPLAMIGLAMLTARWTVTAALKALL